MNKKMRTEELAPEEQNRFLKSKENLERIQKKLAPFIKKDEGKIQSIKEEWCETSHLHLIK